MTPARQGPTEMDQNRPTPARIYDYMLGGDNHFPADRQAAEQILAAVPEVKDAAWANRGFHQRAAVWIAKHGVRQFIDIGSGLPTVGNTHDVVRRVSADSRVVYVDNDPMVRLHSDSLLEGQSGTAVILGDLRDPETILADRDLRALVDFGAPVGLLMTGVMMFVADGSNPWRLVARYLAELAPGSYLSLSHLTGDHKPPRAAAGSPRAPAESQWPGPGRCPAGSPPCSPRRRAPARCCSPPRSWSSCSPGPPRCKPQETCTRC